MTRRSSRTSYLLAAMAAVILTASACSDSTLAPEAVIGTYALEKINSASLPIVSDEDEHSLTVYHSGRMTLSSDMRWAVETVFHVTDKETGEVTADTTTGSGAYSRTGNGVRLRDVPLLGTIDARISGSAMVMEIDFFGDVIVMEYRR